MTLTTGARGAKLNAIEKFLESAADELGLSMSLRGARIRLATEILERHIDTYNDLSDDDLITVERYAGNQAIVSRWLSNNYGRSKRLPGA